jgi:hypothetical protein
MLSKTCTDLDPSRGDCKCSNPILAWIMKLTCLYSGALAGKQITEAFTHMPVLKSLVLDFELQLSDSADAWNVLAKAPAIPTLETLQLNKAFMNMTDFRDFLRKHSATWKSLTLFHLHLANGSMEDIGRIYEMLSQAPKIEEYYQRRLLLGLGEHEYVTFPSGVCYPLVCDENDDGFLEVFQTEWLRWKGHDEVTRVLGEIAGHLLTE